MKQESNDKTICCPEFDPTLWNDKIFEWNNKKFIRESVFTFLYVPIGFGKVMKKLDETITKSNAENPQSMCLSDHTSPWNMDLYLAVDKEITNAENTRMDGTFVCKVYEGSFSETGKWQKDFANWSKTQGYKVSKQFMWYTTCPKCAKKYGQNYVVILAEVEKQ